MPKNKERRPGRHAETPTIVVCTNGEKFSAILDEKLRLFGLNPQSRVCPGCAEWLGVATNWVMLVSDGDIGPAGFDQSTLVRVLLAADFVVIGDGGIPPTIDGRVIVIHTVSPGQWRNLVQRYFDAVLL